MNEYLYVDLIANYLNSILEYYNAQKLFSKFS